MLSKTPYRTIIEIFNNLKSNNIDLTIEQYSFKKLFLIPNVVIDEQHNLLGQRILADMYNIRMIPC